MNQQYIEDNHIVDRYLQGRLSDKEQGEFETYYFDHPQMLEELTIAKAMQNTVREESSHLQASKAAKTKTTVNWFDWVFQPKLSFALSGVMAVGLVSLWFENSRLNSFENAVFPVTSLVLTQSRGSSNEIEVVQIAQDQSAIAIRIIAGPIGYPEVALQLKDSNDNILWKGESKVDGPIGTINLIIMTRQLTSGEYALSVFPPNGTHEALSIHKFRVNQL